MTVKVDANDVLANLQKFIDNGMDDRLASSMEKACLYVEGNTKRNAPVDDGQLRQSITHDVDRNSGSIEGYVGTNVEYAPYVHQGTGIYAVNGDGRQQVPWEYQSADGTFHKTIGQHANPFMKKAIEESKDNLTKYFEGIV